MSRGNPGHLLISNCNGYPPVSKGGNPDGGRVAGCPATTGHPSDPAAAIHWLTLTSHGAADQLATLLTNLCGQLHATPGLEFLDRHPHRSTPIHRTPPATRHHDKPL